MTDKEMKIARYREENKSAVKGQVVFAGSSLMEMFPIRKLQQEKGDDRMIYNRGVGGFLSGELLAVIDVCVTQLLPAKVFINIGTNDLSWSSIPICELMDRYDQILTAIEDAVPGVRIYLMAYYPVNEAAASPEMRDCLKIRTNEKISAANEEVKKLAAKHGQRYIDVNDKLREYTIEGMHINEAGYRAIYDDIMAYVRE